MKGKWQTDAVRHNNNTSHDGSVMRTITRVYPRQPQQYNSFCHFRESISLWSFLHPTLFLSSAKPLYPEPFIITKALPSKRYIHPCFLLCWFFFKTQLALSSQQRPWIILTVVEGAMSTNSQTARGMCKKAQHPLCHIKQSLWPSQAWGRWFYILTLIKSPEV